MAARSLALTRSHRHRDIHDDHTRPAERPPKVRRRPPGARSLFDRRSSKRAVLDSFVKLDPRTLAKNPVMFVVEVGRC